MTKKTTATTTVTTTASDTVLDETPPKLFKLLSATSRTPAIFQALSARGYTHEEHDRGWQLLWDVAGYKRPSDVTRADPAVQRAIADIDAWDEPNFRVAHAALKNEFPAQEALLFAGGLAASTGAQAMLGVGTFLDRLDALDAGDGRDKASRAADKAAIAKLEARGIGKTERARMRDLLARASAAPDAAAPAAGADRGDKLRAARAFFEEWSEIARSVVTRGDHRIALGLAKRTKAKTTPAPPPTTPPTATVDPGA